jgi:hypothetical protein
MLSFFVCKAMKCDYVQREKGQPAGFDVLTTKLLPAAAAKLKTCRRYRKSST